MTPHRQDPIQVRDPVHIRGAHFDDYPGIVSLQRLNGLRTISRQEWCGLWSDNPAYLNCQSLPPMGWVLESTSGELKGYLGNIPLEYSFQGGVVRAATAYSWVVDAPYRGRSIALLDRFLQQPSVGLFIFTTVNEATEKILRAFQFERVPSGQWDTSAFWVTSHKEFTRRAIRAFSLPGISVTANVKRSIRGYFARRSKKKVVSSFLAESEWVDCREFDERFESFWAELCGQNANRLIAVRDRPALRWHYQAGIARGTVFAQAAIYKGRVVAYAVFDRFDHTELGLRRLRFTDFQALAGFEELVHPALDRMLKKCAVQNLHVAENVGCWLEHDFKGVVAPYRRKMKSWLFYYKAKQADLARPLRDARTWNISAYDGDASLS